MGDVQMSIQANNRRILFMFLLVAIFAVILYLVTMFPGIPKVLSEAVFVLFWMALWDSAEFFFVDGRDLQEDKLEAAQLASMAVTFFDKFEDGPAEPEVVQQIMEEMEEEVILPSTQWDQEE